MKMKINALFAQVAFALALLSTLNSQLSTTSLHAAVLTVTSLADSGPGSLRDLVAASIAGDTIQFGVNGIILLNSAIVINHTLFLQGPGPAQLTVSGNQMDRIFIASGQPVFISGMTLRDGLVKGANGNDGPLFNNGQNGDSASGGAILDINNNDDILILSNCWLTGNTVIGGNGGRGGDDGPSFTLHPPGNGGNGGDAVGGALYAVGTDTVVNCTFSQNQAIGGSGGAGGNNIFVGVNISPGTGGSGGNAEGGAAFLTSSLFPSLANCTFSGNVATGGAGGAGGINAAPLTGGSGGSGGEGGCGALAFNYYYTLISCTIVSNMAVGGAGGTGGLGTPVGPVGALGIGDTGGVCGYIGGGCIAWMGNTIVADNYASTIHSNVYIAVHDLGFNFIGDNDHFDNSCTVPPPIGTQVGTIPVPLHPSLGPLAQNGGGLPTHAPVYGGSPIIISPVIDAGFSFGIFTDERGAPRPYDFPSIPNAFGSDVTDIGAFELGSADLGLGTDSNNNLILSWPAYYGDFILQFAIGFQGSNLWNKVPDSPVVVGNQLVVTNRMTNAMMFYRLINQ